MSVKQVQVGLKAKPEIKRKQVKVNASKSEPEKQRKHDTQDKYSSKQECYSVARDKTPKMVSSHVC